MATNTWISTVDTNWNNTTNWSLGRIPQSGDGIAFNSSVAPRSWTSSVLSVPSFDSSGLTAASLLPDISVDTSTGIVRISIQTGGSLIMGASGSSVAHVWGGDAARASSCIFNGQCVNWGAVINCTFNDASSDHSSGFSNYDGTTIWKSSAPYSDGDCSMSATVLAYTPLQLTNSSNVNFNDPMTTIKLMSPSAVFGGNFQCNNAFQVVSDYAASGAGSRFLPRSR